MKILKKAFIALMILAPIIYGATLYEEAGVGPGATADDIRSACRREKFKHHPDKGGNKERFQEVNNACEILQDSDKRDAYDKRLAGSPDVTQITEEQLAITEGTTEEATEEKKPAGCFEDTKKRISQMAKGKAGKLVDILGPKLGELLKKVPIPAQSKTVFNQNIGIKDVSLVTAPTIEGMKCSIGFTGTVNFNEFQVKGTIFAYMRQDKKSFPMSITIELPEHYKLSDMFPSWKGKAIDKLSMPKGKLTISDVEYGSIKPGLNFEAALDLSGPLELFADLQKKAADIPGLVTEGGMATIGGVIPRNVKDFQLRGRLPLKIGVDFVELKKRGKKIPESVTKIFKRITTKELGITVVPADVSVSVDASIEIVLGTQPEPLELKVEGTAKKTKIIMAGSLIGMIELKWFSMGNAALTIEIDEALVGATVIFGIPFTGIGVAGDVGLGKKDNRAMLKGAAKFSLSSTNIPDVLIKVDGSNLNIDDFIQFLSEVAAKQGITKKPIPAGKMPIIKFPKLNGFISTTDTTIGAKQYKKGMSIDADAILFGKAMSIYFYLNPEPKELSIEGSGYLAPIDAKVIQITGAGPDRKIGTADDGAYMHFKAEAAKPENTQLYVTGLLRIPGLDLSQQVDLLFEKNMFGVNLETIIGDAFLASMNININATDPKKFNAAFKFKGDFGKFMNESAKPAVKQLHTDAVAKAAKLDQEFKKQSAMARNARGQLGQAERVVNTLRDNQVRAKWEKTLDTIKGCEATFTRCKPVKFIKDPKGWAKCEKDKAVCSAKIMSDAIAWQAQKGLRGVTRATFAASKKIVETYEKATKKLGELELAKKSASKVLGILKKIVEKITDGAQIFNIKEASGSVSGEELAKGLSPKLIKLEIDIQIPTDVPLIGGKSKHVSIKDKQFNFKNPKESAIKIGKEMAAKLKDMLPKIG